MLSKAREKRMPPIWNRVATAATNRTGKRSTSTPAARMEPEKMSASREKDQAISPRSNPRSSQKGMRCTMNPPMASDIAM